jgi:hypothetical protein
MTELLSVAVLAAAVAWGALRAPGRPFSWTMFSGSSKAFLWTAGDGGRPRLATHDELRLAPDAHYLRATDLRELAQSGLPPLNGLIVASSGSCVVSHNAAGGLDLAPLGPGDDVPCLVAALRRFDEGPGADR